MSQATLSSDTFSTSESFIQDNLSQLRQTVAAPAMVEHLGVAARNFARVAEALQYLFAGFLMVSSFSGFAFVVLWTLYQVAAFLSNDQMLSRFVFSVGAG